MVVKKCDGSESTKELGCTRIGAVRIFESVSSKLTAQTEPASLASSSLVALL